MKAIKNIENKINQLSPGMIGELDQFLNYLIHRRNGRHPKKLKQDWSGGLRDIKMTSIELQKSALDWRQK